MTTPDKMRQITASINAFIKHHSYDAAERALEAFEAAGNVPDGQIWGLKAKLANIRGEFEKAKEAADRVVILLPDNAMSYMVRGRALLGLKEYGDARADAKKALELDIINNVPESKRAASYGLLAQIEVAEGNYEAAKEVAEKALELDPKGAGITILIHAERGLGKLASAADRLNDQILATKKRSDVPRHLKASLYQLLAKIEMERGNSDEALFAATEACCYAPQSPAGFILRAQVERNKGDYEAAMISAKRAAFLAPNSSAAHVVLAQIKMDQGAFMNAQDLAQKVIKLDEKAGAPDILKAVGYGLLAQVAMFKNEHNNAIKAAQQAVILSANSPISLTVLAQAQMLGGQLKEAKETVALLKSSNINNSHIANLEVCILLKEGNLTGASNRLQQALQDQFVPQNLVLAKKMVEGGFFAKQMYEILLESAASDGLIPPAHQARFTLDERRIGKKSEIDQFLRDALKLTIELPDYAGYLHSSSELFTDVYVPTPISGNDGRAASFGAPKRYRE